MQSAMLFDPVRCLSRKINLLCKPYNLSLIPNSLKAKGKKPTPQNCPLTSNIMICVADPFNK